MEIEQHWQHVHIRQRERAPDKMAGLRQRMIEDGKLPLELRQGAFDDRAVWAAVRGAREEVCSDIGARDQRIEMRVDDRDPLLGSRAADRSRGASGGPSNT